MPALSESVTLYDLFYWEVRNWFIADLKISYGCAPVNIRLPTTNVGMPLMPC